MKLEDFWPSPRLREDVKPVQRLKRFAQRYALMFQKSNVAWSVVVLAFRAERSTYYKI